MLSLTRCPIPEICRVTNHWTMESRRVCAARQRAISRSTDAAQDVQVHLDPYEAARRADRDRALAAHAPVSPSDPAEQVLARNGERQLMTLDRSDLTVIDLLLATDVYRINRQLRSGGSLNVSPGAMLDWNGYGSLERFINEAVAVFRGLGQAVRLDEPLHLFRGLGIPCETGGDARGFAGLGRHLAGDGAWDGTFTDAGFGFAAADPHVALKHDGRWAGTGPLRPVMVELEARAGLCLPQRRHRSRKLFEHTLEQTFLMDLQDSQVVFAPGTGWEITGVQDGSVYGIPLVTMKQTVEVPR